MTAARTLTEADLDALRAIVRDEVRRAPRSAAQQKPRRRRASPVAAPPGIVPTDIERATAKRALRKAGLR